MTAPPLDFLPDDTPALNRRIVEYAHADVGECEEPPGSNRGRYPDMVNTEFGSPLGSYWCANAASHEWKHAGATLPPVPGQCESWHQWAKVSGTFHDTPVIGAAVLYSADGKRADHIGIVARIVADPTAPKGRRVMTIEGNTSLTTYDRNGWVMDLKAEDAHRVLGYVYPEVAT